LVAERHRCGNVSEDAKEKEGSEIGEKTDAPFEESIEGLGKMEVETARGVRDMGVREEWWPGLGG
jgi:hypothetical protein